MKETNYDHFAAAYSTENQGSLLNAYYERPAMLELAGGVEGHQVLDAGCGSGPSWKSCAIGAPMLLASMPAQP